MIQRYVTSIYLSSICFNYFLEKLQPIEIQANKKPGFARLQGRVCIHPLTVQGELCVGVYNTKGAPIYVVDREPAVFSPRYR